MAFDARMTSSSARGASDDTAMAAAFGLAAFAVLSWGITPAITAFQVTELPALQGGLMRSVLAVPPALFCIWWLKLKLPKDATTWMWLVLAGFAAFCGFPILFTLGIARTSTAHAALILACMPVISGALGAMLDRRMPRPGWLAGAAIAMAGEVVLITARDSSGEATLSGDLLCIAAAIISGSGYVAGSRATAKIGTWSTTFWGVTIAGLTQVPVLVWLALDVDWSGVGWVGWSSTTYMVMFSTVLAYAAWYWALNHGSVARIAPVQFSQPLVSLVFAVLLLNEVITPPIMISTATILSGIVLASRAQRPPKKIGSGEK